VVRKEFNKLVFEKEVCKLRRILVWQCYFSQAIVFQ